MLLDNRMPGLTGLEVAERILAEHPDQVIVLFTAHLDDALQEKARAIGITACASKMESFRIPEIIRTLLQPRRSRRSASPQVGVHVDPRMSRGGQVDDLDRVVRGPGELGVPHHDPVEVRRGIGVDGRLQVPSR